MNRYVEAQRDKEKKEKESARRPDNALQSADGQPAASAFSSNKSPAAKKGAKVGKIDEGMLAVVSELEAMVEKRHDVEMVTLTYDNRMTSEVLPNQLLLEIEKASDEQMRDNELLSRGKANVLSEIKAKKKGRRKVAAEVETSTPNPYARLWGRDNVVDEETVLRALETTLAHQTLGSIRIAEVEMRALEMVSKAVQAHLKDVLELAVLAQQSSAVAQQVFGCISSNLDAAEAGQGAEGVMLNVGMLFGPDHLRRMQREEADCCGALLAARESKDMLASISSGSGGRAITVSNSSSSGSSSSGSKKRKMESSDPQDERTVGVNALAAAYALEDVGAAETTEELARLSSRRQLLLQREETSPFEQAATLTGEALRQALRRSLSRGLATDGAFFRARLGLAARATALQEG